MLGNGEYNPIDREIDQMTGFSNMLDNEDNGDITSMREYSFRKTSLEMAENRDNRNFSGDIETLTGEMNLRTSQEIGSLLNGVNSQIESAISTDISERIIPQMQDVVDAVLARQLESVPGMSRRPHNSENDVRSLNENNLTNRNFHSHQNFLGLQLLSRKLHVIMTSCMIIHDVKPPGQKSWCPGD